MYKFAGESNQSVYAQVPLVNSNLLGSMAVTIMGGLMFATILTLVFIPTLYVIFFRIPTSRN